MESKLKFYKIMTFLLMIVIVIGALVAGFFFYGNSRFNAGQQLAFSTIAHEINKRGFVAVQNEDENITLILVPSQAIDFARQQALLDIINIVQSQGYVSLYSNLTGNYTEIILVPYNAVSER
ncbi:MAG: hypothetical protein QW244_00520 [Candidatus Pacearchaeota archaeon]